MPNNGEVWSTTTRTDGEDAAARWDAMLSETHLPWTTQLEPDDAGSFEACIRRWWIDDLALVDCECSPCSGTRQRRQMADTEGEYVIVLMTRAGRETVSQGDAEATLSPGDAVVWDSTSAARFQVWERLSKRSLLVPRAAFGEVSGRGLNTAGVRLSDIAPATKLLTSYLDTLSQTLPMLGAAAVAAARNATLELLVGALRGESDVTSSDAASPALRAAMNRYIERHLLDGSISPEEIAAAHGVSIRTVNRIFNATGQTVGEVIRVRRLAHARLELADATRSVGAIAHRWGFSDSSHFSRTFKAHYGSSPSDYRVTLHAAGDIDSDVANVQSAGAVVQGAAVESPKTEVATTRV